MLSTEVTRFAIPCQIQTFGVFWGKSVWNWKIRF